MFTKLVKRMWRRRKKGGAFSPVVILTGNELYGRGDPWQSWRNLGGGFAKYENYRGGHDTEMQSLSDCTQALYLDLDPWAEMRK